MIVDKVKTVETVEQDSRITLSQRMLAHLELADPVTWLSGIMVVICGAVASSSVGGFDFGNPQHLWLVALGTLMAGPLGTGYSQSINDYYDRELDAINDPSRPIPSGRVGLRAAQLNWIALAAGTLLVSFCFGKPVIVLIAVLALFLATAYSVPPLKLKRNFWVGPPSVGLGYVVLSWMAGHLIFAPLTAESVLVAIINGGLATGLLFLNDIKSVEGDRRLGMKSLTVVIGVKRALLVAFTVINSSLLSLMLLAFLWGHPGVGIFTLLAVVVPFYAEVKLYSDPTHENFKRYLLASNAFIALLQFISAFVVGGYFG